MGIWLWVVSEGSVSVCAVLLKSVIYGHWWFLFLLLCPSGKISLLENTALKNFHNQLGDFHSQVDMSSNSGLLKEDVYQELHLRGYNYGPTFQGVLECNSEGEVTFYRWMMSMVIAMMNICSFNFFFINSPPDCALCANYTLCDNGEQLRVLTEHWESCYLQCRTD